MKKILFILLLLPVLAEAQIITTIAGTGSATFSGDGVPATAAGIADPLRGVFDQYGNYYFADASNSNRIRKIGVTGFITTIAGNGIAVFGGDNGPATAANLNLPLAVKFDSSGNMYIADGGNHRIRKVNMTTGIITTIAGNGTGAYGGDGGPATAALLYGPDDLCFDKLGNLYIADEFNYRIRKIDASGTISTFAGNGIPGYSGDYGPATAAQINTSLGIVADDTGNIYIADYNSYVIRKVNTSGIITTFAGNGSRTYIGDGMPAINAQFEPSEIGIDSINQLYIADQYNVGVYRIDLAGIIHLVAGNGVSGFSGDNGPATAAEFNTPAGIAIDRQCGNLYIPDVINGRIRKVIFDSTCSSEPLTVKEIKETYVISIYPNPTNDIIHIDGVTVNTQYHLQNIVGTVLQEGVLYQGTNSIPIQSLPSGMYMLEVTNNDGERTVKKIIKQ